MDPIWLWWVDMLIRAGNLIAQFFEHAGQRPHARTTDRYEVNTLDVLWDLIFI